jgi:hypothetical protein
MADTTPDLSQFFRKPSPDQAKRILALLDDLWNEASMVEHPPGTRPACTGSWHSNMNDNAVLCFTKDGDELAADVHREVRKLSANLASEGSISGGISSYAFDTFKASGGQRRPVADTDVDGLLQCIARQPMAGVKDYLVVLPVVGASVGEQPWAALGLTLAQPTMQAVLAAGKLLGWSTEKWESKAERDRLFFEEAWSAGQCVAVVHAKGAAEGVREHARATARAQLAALNLILWPYARDLCPMNLLEDNVCIQFDERHIAETGDFTSSGCRVGQVNNDKIATVPLDAPNLKELFGTEFHQNVSRIVADATSGKAKGFREQLADMLIWLGRSVLTRESTEKLLFAIVALEAGLGLANDEKITNTLARYTAFLLSDDGKKRLAIYRRVKHWYGLRSEVVHAGRPVTSKAEADHALQTVYRAAGRLLELSDRFKSKGEFQAHMEAVNVGGSSLE